MVGIQSLKRVKSAANHAFSLIELLVVIAITSILLVIITKPLIDGFNLVNRASTQIESQDTARDTLRELSAQLSNAVFVYDNNTPQTKINLWLYDQKGNPYLTSVPYGLIEFVSPGLQGEQGNNPNQPIDPTTGLPIVPGAQVALPLAPGRTITRFFIGLHDNRSGVDTSGYKQSGMPVDGQGNYHGYANRWTDPQLASRDNRMTLYRVEFTPYIPDPDNPSTFIPNLSLLHTGTNPSAPTDSKTDPLILDDPNFFYDATKAGAGDTGDPKWGVPGWQKIAERYGMPTTVVYRWENWAALAQNLIQANKGDAIYLDRDNNGNIVYDANAHPTPHLLISFVPSSVQNEAATPMSASAAGDETPYSAPPVYQARYGAWATPYGVSVYRSSTPGADPLSQNPLTYFQYYVDAAGNGHVVEQTVNQGAVPPDPATLPDIGPDPNPLGFWTNTTNLQFAFTVDPVSGLVNFAFPQWVLNLQSGYKGPQVYSPADINAGYGGAYNSRYILLSDRFDPALDLVAPPVPPPAEQANTTSPLGYFLEHYDLQNPFKVLPEIVPGSEVVIGPDQRPGPHYGYAIQYTRVPSSQDVIGPNQYKINYMVVPGYDLNDITKDGKHIDWQSVEWRLMVGYIAFDNQPETLQSSGGDNPLAGLFYRHNLPTQKVVNGQDVPADPVQVTYQFQLNQPSDVVKVSYRTRSLIDVVLSARLFDPSSATAQDTNLVSKVRVRNLQR
ncbi:MAG TPA: type II secretion system protein [Chthonomonas sp.]|uniref:PulJ/GspJ family protein n=1 Tax=Chthonomonas sp. TaxID=2282153 RepID=UPI002B4ACE9F|nr:type II secretion system protein [Chthonomonas sp.]HLI49233.1 type II secretion system protein [Chthonomonas sp.]